MPNLTVGPTSTYASISAAMADAAPGDTVTLQAGYSNETAVVTRNNLTIVGQAGSLGIVLQLALGIPTVTLAGTAPINILDASDGNGIVGNTGDNQITVSGGVDAVDGGLGTDRLIVDYRQATGAVTGDSTSNFTEAGGGGRSVTITNGTIENFTVLTGSGADTITTGAGNDIIRTANGASVVNAGQGANTIIGGRDADTITALDGGNFINAGNGANTITSGGSNDTILTGVDADTVVAGGGNDLITLRGGADSVDAGSGSDRLIIDYSAMTSGVIGGITGGNFGTGYTGHIADAGVNVIDFVGSEHFTITTGSGNDSIVTGDGNDILSGGAGDDNMAGGRGNDFYVVESVGDVITGEIGFAAGGGIDTVRVFVDNYVQPNSIELTRLGNVTDTTNLSATGNDAPGTLVGNAGDNNLTGRGGNDQIYGHDGADTLTGNTGRDTLVGGEGPDVFVYTAVADSRAGSAERDFINGFARGSDQIDLSAIDANTGTFGINDAFTFIGTAAFTAAGQVRVQGLGGPNGLIVEVNVNAGLAADMHILVNLQTTMQAGDFIL